LFDLHGNRFEWTHAWFEDCGVEAITDPLGAKEGSSRVHRGGCWGLDAAVCRSAIRDTFDPTYRASSSGFRLALSPSAILPEAAHDKSSGASRSRHVGSVAEQRPEMP
jgi:formylglycine-generating enzyme required for sulfatase activity